MFKRKDMYSWKVKSTPISQTNVCDCCLHFAAMCFWKKTIILCSTLKHTIIWGSTDIVVEKWWMFLLQTFHVLFCFVFISFTLVQSRVHLAPSRTGIESLNSDSHSETCFLMQNENLLREQKAVSDVLYIDSVWHWNSPVYSFIGEGWIRWRDKYMERRELPTGEQLLRSAWRYIS